MAGETMKLLRRVASLVAVFAAVPGSAVWAHSTDPLGKVEHDWRPDPAIKTTYSLNFDFHAGGYYISWSPPARVVQREGRECLAGAYMIFDVDDRFAFDTDETISLDLTFYRPETDGFILSYDEAVKPTPKQVRFDESSKNQTWHTETVSLPRARFANRRYYGTDLAVGGIGSQLSHPEGSGEAVLCDVKLRRAAGTPAARPGQGTVSLKIVDENGNPTQARVGLYRADGWAPLTDTDAIRVQRYEEFTRELPMVIVPNGWSQIGRYAFFVDGAYESTVPSGDYRLYVMKGPEYRIHKSNVTIKAGETRAVDVALARFDDLPARGWLSGDDHLHITRASPARNAETVAFMQAEDVHLSNMLQAANLVRTSFKQYAFGADGVHTEGNFFVAAGQESPRTAHRGHTIGLNAKSFHWREDEYFFYDNISDLIRADGGLWGYAHVAVDAFNLKNGLALDVPRGKVDFLEMLQFATLDTSYLYEFLNMGFKLLPSAGSDYPYVGFPGDERVYVHIDGTPTAAAWFENFKSGRSFITNWMSADFSVNGDDRAVEFEIRAGDPVTVDAVVKLNPDFDRLDRVELVAHGEVLHKVTAPADATELKISHTLTPAGSQWLALRAYGKVDASLHTVPVYVYVDGDRDFSNRDKVDKIAKKYRDVLQKFRNSTPDPADDFERFDVEDALLPSWKESKPKLDGVIDEAITKYNALIQAQFPKKKE